MKTLAALANLPIGTVAETRFGEVGFGGVTRETRFEEIGFGEETREIHFRDIDFGEVTFANRHSDIDFQWKTQGEPCGQEPQTCLRWPLA